MYVLLVTINNNNMDEEHSELFVSLANTLHSFMETDADGSIFGTDDALVVVYVQNLPTGYERSVG